MIKKLIPLGLLLLLLLTPRAIAQVLGPCGTEDVEKTGAALQSAPAQATERVQKVSRMPLPGERAPNFELSALMGNGNVKKVKLSDYNGKWKVVCFYPADFTFV